MTYKDNLAEGYGCLCLAYSDDGIHWREDPSNPAFIGLRDTWQNMVFDPVRERWLMFGRPVCTAGVGDVSGGPTEHNFKRRTAVMVGETPYDFGQPRVVMWPEEVDDPDIDHMVVSRVGSHFIGFVGMMGRRRTWHSICIWRLAAMACTGICCPTGLYIFPHGGSDAFDSGSTSGAGGIVSMGNTDFIYYRGSRHGQAQGNRNNVSGIGRAQFLRDRFVAQMGAHTGGFLLTREMIVAAPELIVNTTVADGYNSDPATAIVPPNSLSKCCVSARAVPRVPCPVHSCRLHHTGC